MIMIPLLIGLIITIFNTLLIFILYVRYKRHLGTRIAKNTKIKTTLVLGPGGHTREMVEIYKLLDSERHEFSFVHSRFDRISPMLFTHKLLKTLNQESKDPTQVVSERNVKALFHTLPFPSNSLLLYTFAIIFFILNMAKSIAVSYRLNSDLIITNGPGLSVPFCLSIKLLNVLLLRNTKIVYIESLARVKTLSLSGRLLSRLVDRFVVLWPGLSKCKNAQYLGTIQRLVL